MFTGTNTTGPDAEVKELEDLKRRARVLRQQYAGTATSRPEVAKSLHAEVYKVETLKDPTWSDPYFVLPFC